MSLREISEAFIQYKTFPLISYNKESPVLVFQSMYPHNYYSKQIEEFLKLHDYTPDHRGSDLPWWGKDYFYYWPGTRAEKL